QSTAYESRCTFTSPFFTVTSATHAVYDSNEKYAAIPRPAPFGTGLPQSPFSAAVFKTFFNRAVSNGLPCFGFVKSVIFRSSPINFIRNSYGSATATAASSSTKHSTMKPLEECSTDRHHARGTPDFAKVYSTW